MRWHILIVAKNSAFPLLSGEADARTAGSVQSPKNARSNAGAVDQGGTGNEVRG
jgi:hypothetical protein